MCHLWFAKYLTRGSPHMSSSEDAAAAAAAGGGGGGGDGVLMTASG